MLDRRLKIAAIVLAVIGVGIAGYLTYVHYAGINPVCSIAHGCIKVQTSEWAKVHGVPVAVIGLVGYVLILGSLLFLPGDLGRGASAALSLFGFLYSAYLTSRELFSIHAICQWCVMSAITMTALTVVTIWRLLASPTLGGGEEAEATGPPEPSTS
ncbi:MAG TPA: vitamin K epoxide reductase family protein [Solirubrobacteraceae bacterium]|nr:vitamin K epoxide reductase family protein [Solirubrobacteraceae bacterium]